LDYINCGDTNLEHSPEKSLSCLEEDARIYSLPKQKNDFKAEMPIFHKGVWYAEYVRTDFISKTTAAFPHH
jgi:hypothetical protein